ncbi:E3 ubiquitin/ISG15 ligase TRIM25 isoform X2 [Sphaeramia orbicularis]|uniref:E3 ubiquitin/ISG15 ligase TRIM25-like n=1 Tax=Sphaeramia orbicularis TaxID=375764 RepID=A0A672YS23_9TELE|nr:E3 ubiquitin/ISG15 ligase TRIM25-like isoform X2 [Sphaeramia orbicularis]
MAEVDEGQFSLLGLEDELTCSICLSPFDCPVTIPCGHNFCQSCLNVTWTDSYICPQCRTHFATKPELKKNTVLSTVVETFKGRSGISDAGSTSLSREQSQTEDKPVPAIRCDTCMEAEASQTCLTCMASFCEEHLRPHKENPIFRLHQLSEPVGDLSERICPDHNKLMELFCCQHSQPICSLCLQQLHKGCPFVSPEEQRNKKESDLRANLDVLDGKIMKNANVLTQMKNLQDTLKDSATNRKRAMAVKYQQMREMLVQAEHEAMNAVDREVETGQTKLSGLMKKLNENIEKMSKAKEDIHSQLKQTQTLAFLKGSYQLPQAVNFDPYTPRISLDSKKVLASQAFTTALKEYLTELLNRPVEARLPLFTAGEKPTSASGFKPWSSGPQQVYGFTPDMLLPGPTKLPRSHSPGPNSQAKGQQKKKPQKPNKKTLEPSEINMAMKNLSLSMEQLPEVRESDKPRGRPATAKPKEKSETADIPPTMISAEKRNELLKYGTVLTFDEKTAHKRIMLSEGFTKASVTEHINYPDCPERFAVCSQVLASKGFSRGRHYWEVKLSCNNFIGIGLAYGTMNRKGPTSRLGRNDQSWCVEWFNVKLSAWHNSSETVLVNPNPKRVGVLLDCDGGTATFYNVADRAYPFHSFVFPFASAVYPAFWIFSSGSSVSLCKLQG